MEWAAFEYRDYWDYPMILVVAFDGSLYLLDAPFDEVIEDYAGVYTIKMLDGPPESRSWVGLGSNRREIGSLAIVPELFDYRGQIRVDLIRAAINLDLSSGWVGWL